MRQVITEREEVHRMSSKNKTEVLIDGKIYTLSGYESEEYLQRVATYINNKLAELKKLDGYARLSQELKSILLELNVADDYFKAKNQVEMVEEELAQKDQELYDLKHELISTQISKRAGSFKRTGNRVPEADCKTGDRVGQVIQTEVGTTQRAGEKAVRHCVCQPF